MSCHVCRPMTSRLEARHTTQFLINVQALKLLFLSISSLGCLKIVHVCFLGTKLASQRLLIANSTLWQPRDSLFSAPPQFHSIIYQNPHWYSAIPKTFTFYQTLSHISNTEIQLLSCKNFASPFYFINRERNQSVGIRIVKLKKKIKASRIPELLM